MELMNGYKQTELGLIPEDWLVISIGDALKIRHGKNQNQVLDPNGEYPILGTGGLMGFANDFLYARPSVLIGRKGTINKPMFLDKPFWTVDTLFYSEINKAYSEKFLYYKFLQIDWYSYNEASGVPSLNTKTIESVKITIPINKSEQIRIENNLTDADAYIASLEKLIKKKRKIKQGVIQELLKPKDGWETKSLGDIGKTFGGLSGKSKDDFTEGVYPYIPFMNIMLNPIIDTEYFDYVNLKSGESQNLALKGDLFFNGSSETPEEVGMCSVLLEDIPNLYLNSFCFGFRIKSDLKINGLYLSYYFRSEEGRKLFFSMAQGATRYNLSKSNFNKLKVLIPAIQEQNMIAERLFDLDSDIKINEVKLEKAKSIKQGMMQNLLTGKIRLI